MALTDLLVLLVVFAGTIISAMLLRRRRIRGRGLLVSVWFSFYGLVLTAMMVAHSAEILYRTYGASRGGSAPPYDFRLYSLLLLAALLVLAGAACLGVAPALGRGGDEARRTALRASAGTLVLVVPLIPIQKVFGTLLTCLSLLSLLVLARGTRSEKPATAAHPTAPPPVVRA